ncbi:MAG TPA: hypothetical protein EYG51_23055 [Pseudomonadales bacterium]|nr:hypothetical protein [Pseudomonadales bacterium]
MINQNRLQQQVQFYNLLERLEQKEGVRYLRNCHGRMEWPKRGIYFFMEDGEQRSDTGDGLRIVRVGTHAISGSSKTTLWNRLSQHRGNQKSGGGNHRGSIFRLIVGTAILDNLHIECDTWGKGSTAPRSVRDNEIEVEQLVSAYIGNMPFLWLDVGDQPGPNSQRGYIERNAIALLSNTGKPNLDSPSQSWLGHQCDRDRVKKSGLWNQNHTGEDYAPAFLDTLERLIDNLRVPAS